MTPRRSIDTFAALHRYGSSERLYMPEDVDVPRRTMSLVCGHPLKNGSTCRRKGTICPQHGLIRDVHATEDTTEVLREALRDVRHHLVRGDTGAALVAIAVALGEGETQARTIASAMKKKALNPHPKGLP